MAKVNKAELCGFWKEAVLRIPRFSGACSAAPRNRGHVKCRFVRGSMAVGSTFQVRKEKDRITGHLLAEHMENERLEQQDSSLSVTQMHEATSRVCTGSS